MKKLFLFGFLGALCFSSSANDSAVTGVGGRWQRLGKEHASVRMVSEVVDLVIRNQKVYDTTARFVFKNDGPSQIVQMGFPESSHNDTDGMEKGSFKGFSTAIDGIPFRAVRRYKAVGDSDFDALWVKSVPFKRGQTRRITVRYRSTLGGTAGMPSVYWAPYQFTGGNWKGKVDKSVLNVTLAQSGTYLVKFNTQKPKPKFVRTGNKFSFEWRNWQAEENFQFHLFTTFRDWVAPKDDNIRLGSGFSADYNEYYQGFLPVNIDLPGQKRSESQVNWPAPGVVRGGRLFLRLNDWMNRQPEGSVRASYDKTTRAVTVQKNNRSASFKAGENGVFAVKLYGENMLYVPASTLTRLFGGGVGFDVKNHRLNYLSP